MPVSGDLSSNPISSDKQEQVCRLQMGLLLNLLHVTSLSCMMTSRRAPRGKSRQGHTDKFCKGTGINNQKYNWIVMNEVHQWHDQGGAAPSSICTLVISMAVFCETAAIHIDDLYLSFSDSLREKSQLSPVCIPVNIPWKMCYLRGGV